MSADKFTPGPWKVQPRSNNMIDITHGDNAKGAITFALCRVQSRQSWVEESTANARLIAAAPALYEALQAVLEVAGVRIDDARIGVFDNARAALALVGGNHAD